MVVATYLVAIDEVPVEVVQLHVTIPHVLPGGRNERRGT